MVGELDILRRAHDLFAGSAPEVGLGAQRAGFRPVFDAADSGAAGRADTRYRMLLAASREVLAATADTDAGVTALLDAARRDHGSAREHSDRILAQARADVRDPAASPLAQREALRRSIARLQAQHRLVSTTRGRAAARARLLRRLRYAAARRRAGLAMPPASGGAAAAVAAALSRLGRPYVWGATGPDRFDCSGLVQWAYRQAGIDLPRTTYDQIHSGIAVPAGHIQPGDLVFPHTGHVQIALGKGMVVEAPHAGANVRIAHMGDVIAIRRPF